MGAVVLRYAKSRAIREIIKHHYNKRNLRETLGVCEIFKFWMCEWFRDCYSQSDLIFKTLMFILRCCTGGFIDYYRASQDELKAILKYEIWL